jgi:hypothetical protein
MQRARMRARQNRAWRIVKSLADPMLTTVKALGSVRVAELIVSRTLSESQSNYNVLTLLVSGTMPSPVLSSLLVADSLTGNVRREFLNDAIATSLHLGVT